MYSLLKAGADGMQEFMCDKKEDIETLPTSVKAGSTAFVVDGSEGYILNNKKKWVNIF